MDALNSGVSSDKCHDIVFYWDKYHCIGWFGLNCYLCFQNARDGLDIDFELILLPKFIQKLLNSIGKII